MYSFHIYSFQMISFFYVSFWVLFFLWSTLGEMLRESEPAIYKCPKWLYKITERLFSSKLSTLMMVVSWIVALLILFHDH